MIFYLTRWSDWNDNSSNNKIVRIITTIILPITPSAPRTSNPVSSAAHPPTLWFTFVSFSSSVTPFVDSTLQLRGFYILASHPILYSYPFYPTLTFFPTRHRLPTLLLSYLPPSALNKSLLGVYIVFWSFLYAVECPVGLVRRFVS